MVRQWVARGWWQALAAWGASQWQKSSLAWRNVCLFTTLLCGMLCAPSASAQNVTFINPGKTSEAYWLAVSQVMEQAARSLGMRLEVMYAERNRLIPISMVEEIVKRPAAQKPDYLILANESSIAPEVLRLLDGAGIRVFFAFSGVQQALRAQTGEPRQKYPFWLGSLEPRGEDAGYLTAKALIDKARAMPHLRAADGKLHVIAIAGDRSTPASIARNLGMRKAIQEAADVSIAQEVYGNWRRDRALEQATVLYQRYPQARIVWAGNDLMAFGAMEAWRQQGGVPGKDALFSAINTSNEALQARLRGEMSALAGGHFMAGGWAMVMLYDHAKGIDFASEGVDLEYPMFVLLDESNIPTFEERFGTLRSTLDFKMFSKFHNPRIQKYDFDIRRLLR